MRLLLLTPGIARLRGRAVLGVIFGLMAFCALEGEARAQNPATAVYPSAVADDDDLLCWTNAAETRLSSEITAGATSITVWSSAGFCAPTVVQIGAELIKISAVSDGTMTVASGGRGWNGTTAAAHYNSSLVKGYVAAAWFNQVSAELKSIQTTLGADLENLSQVPGSGTTAQYLRGDASWQTLDTDAVAEAGGLYYTTARARAAVSGGANVTYTEGTGVFAVNAFPYASLSGVPATFAPSLHASAHEDGGADEMSLAGLSVAWADLTSVPATFAPSAHAASHGAGQADAVTIAESQISDLAHFDGAYSSLSGVPATFAPTAHATAHEDGGADEIDLAGLAVAYADLTGVPSTFAPSAHASSHGAGQADAVTIAESQISDLSHFDGAYGSLSGVPATFTPSAHVLDSASHTVSGLTTGHLLQATGATTFGFAGLSAGQIPVLDAAKITTGAFADARVSESSVTQHEAALAVTEAQITDLTHFDGVYGSLSGVPSTFAPSAHATAHQDGGADEMSLAGLAVAWADLTSVPSTFAPSAHAASHGAGQADAVTIAESQISDLAHFDGAYSSLSGVPATFAPSAHATAHHSGGGDALTLGSLAGTLSETALDGAGAAFGAGSGVDYDSGTNVLAVDTTEFGNQTWGGGGTSTQTWTWNVTGTDPAIAFGDNSITLTAATVTASGLAIAGTQITSGEIGDARIPAGITRDAEIDTFAELDAVVADQTLVHSGSNIATATALAANGANCSAGSVAAGVDASGAAEGCLDPIVSTEIDASSEIAAIVADETGSGALVFGTAPTLTTPIIGGYTVAGLPAAGSAGRVAVVTDADSAGDCDTGGGSDLAWCRDSGAAWVPLGDGGSGGGAVSSVFTRTGAVVAATSDYDAIQVDNTPAGGISATNVQAAIDELDTEKADAFTVKQVMAGTLVAGASNTLALEPIEGVAATITRIYCETVTSTVVLTVNVADDMDGTNAAAAHGSTITCDDDGETVTSLTGDASIAAGQLVTVTGGTEGGTFDEATFNIVWTIP